MSGRQGSAADVCTVDDGRAVDADGPASLPLCLELFVPSLLFGDYFPQQRKLLVLGSGTGGSGSVGFLIFFDRAREFLFFRGWHDVSHGCLLCRGLVTLVVVFHVH